MDKARFWQLYELAEDGDVTAQGDLWAEFQFIYASDDPAAFGFESSPERTERLSC